MHVTFWLAVHAPQCGCACAPLCGASSPVRLRLRTPVRSKLPCGSAVRTHAEQYPVCWSLRWLSERHKLPLQISRFIGNIFQTNLLRNLYTLLQAFGCSIAIARRRRAYLCRFDSGGIFLSCSRCAQTWKVWPLFQSVLRLQTQACFGIFGQPILERALSSTIAVSGNVAS